MSRDAGASLLGVIGAANESSSIEVVAERVRWLCEPFTFRALSEATGCNCETIRRMIRTRQFPSLEFALAICREGRVSPFWLFFGIGPVWTDPEEMQSAVIRNTPMSALLNEVVQRIDSIGAAVEADRPGHDTRPGRPHRAGAGAESVTIDTARLMSNALSAASARAC